MEVNGRTIQELIHVPSGNVIFSGGGNDSPVVIQSNMLSYRSENYVIEYVNGTYNVYSISGGLMYSINSNDKTTTSYNRKSFISESDKKVYLSENDYGLLTCRDLLTGDLIFSTNISARYIYCVTFGKYIIYSNSLSNYIYTYDIENNVKNEISTDRFTYTPNLSAKDNIVAIVGANKLYIYDININQKIIEEQGYGLSGVSAFYEDKIITCDANYIRVYDLNSKTKIGTYRHGYSSSPEDIFFNEEFLFISHDKSVICYDTENNYNIYHAPFVIYNGKINNNLFVSSYDVWTGIKYLIYSKTSGKVRDYIFPM